MIERVDTIESSALHSCGLKFLFLTKSGESKCARIMIQENCGLEIAIEGLRDLADKLEEEL